MTEKAAGLLLSHETALAYWSNPLLPESLPVLDGRDASRLLARARGSLHVDMLEAMMDHPLFAHLPARIDALVPTHGDRRSTKRAVLHAWATALPKGALCAPPEIWPPLDEGSCRIAISSPEFTFLQMAQLLGDLELAELGCELCGEYALAPLAEGGMVRRLPVTSPARIAAFLRKANGAPGIMRARKTAAWLAAGSCSPRESQLALLACIPRKHGGAGLPKPLLSPRLDPPAQAALVLDTAWVRPDLYWPHARVALEYDSRAHHDGVGPAEHDARKRNAYELMGVDAFSVTPGQAMDVVALFGLYAAVAKRLGLRRARPTAEMLAARRDAHCFLMHGERRRRWTDPALVPVR